MTSFTKHSDPYFYLRNGFCRTDCARCDELDAQENLPSGEALAEGISLAIDAVIREEDRRGNQ